MLLFCPSCSNVLTVSTVVPSSIHQSTPQNQAANPSYAPGSDSPTVGQGWDENTPVNRLECQTCPYQYVLKKSFYERKAFARKEREDVFGGPGAWDNADKIKIQCSNAECDGYEAAFFQVQIRSADEPMTSFYKCMTCGNRWREN